MTNSLSQQLDNERKRKVVAVQTLTIVENSNADLKRMREQKGKEVMETGRPRPSNEEEAHRATK